MRKEAMCEGSYRYRQSNRTTSYNSLLGFVVLLMTDDKETFVKAYELAAHDSNGAGVWYYMNKRYLKLEDDE